MIKRLFLLLPLLVICYGCSDDECPTCVDDSSVLFYCSASFHAADTEFGAFQSSIGITAGFIGDPVPSVSVFEWLNGKLRRSDNGFPTFNDDIQSDFIKHVSVTAVLDSDTIDFAVTIPDSTHIITPGDFAPSGQPIKFEWTRSRDAESYIYSAVVFYNDGEDLVFLLDTTIQTSDTSITIPSEYAEPGNQIVSQLIAGAGRNGEPGDEPNFRAGRIFGFIVGSYKAGFHRTDVVF